MTKMVLGGLWHGANWTFVVWGALHGTYLIAHRLLNDGLRRLGIIEGTGPDRALATLGTPVTFLLVLVTWVFFRAGRFGDAWSVLVAMRGQAEPSGKVVAYRPYELAIVTASAALEPRLVKAAERVGILWWWSVPFWLRGGAYSILALMVLAFGGATQKFIYFDV